MLGNNRGTALSFDAGLSYGSCQGKLTFPSHESNIKARHPASSCAQGP